MKKDMKWSLIIFSIGVFMAALDNGIITSSLTTLIHSFGISATWGAWTITLYTLGLAIAVPIAGKLSDRYGRKKLFIVEVTLFGLGSLLVALSPNFTMFLISRFVQALGGGGIFIIASSYVLNTFPKENHGKALGALGGMNGIAAVLGPNVGSFILGATNNNWHWLFLINLPIAVLLIIFGIKFINEKQELVRTKLDWSGLVILSAAILSFMYGLTRLDGVHVASSLTSAGFLGFVGAGLLLLVILYFIERKVTDKGNEAILPLNLLANSSYRWTLALAAFSGAILASVIFIPGYVEQFLNIASDQSGYWFTPLALASGIGAASGGALVDKKGPIFTITSASIVAAVGFLLFPIWVDSTWQMVIASCLVGLGFGTMLGAPINVLATERSEDNKGIALATTSLFRQMGMTIAPTMYAGFLARSFQQFGAKTEENFQKANIQVSPDMVQHVVAGGDFASMKAGLEKIPDLQVKQVLLDTLHQVVGHGYNGLFYSSLVISLVMLLSVLILGSVRRKQQPLNDTAGNR